MKMFALLDAPNPGALERLVEKYLEKGWMLSGHVVVFDHPGGPTARSGVHFYQAMIKIGNTEKEDDRLA